MDQKVEISLLDLNKLLDIASGSLLILKHKNVSAIEVENKLTDIKECEDIVEKVYQQSL